MPDEQPTSVSETVIRNAQKPLINWVWIYERVGLPTFIIFIVGYSVVRVVNWAEPKIDLLINKHVEFIDKTDAKQTQVISIAEKNAETNKETTEILQRMTTEDMDSARINGEHKKITEEIRDDVKIIKDAVVPDIRPRPTGTAPKHG